jgi:acyl-CoA carboxylase epsilon subunit
VADAGTLPLLRVVRGKASAEETAALVAALAIARVAARRAVLAEKEGRGRANGRIRSGWGGSGPLSSTPLRHGPGAWRASGLPH